MDSASSNLSCTWNDSWGGEDARTLVTRLYFGLSLPVAVLSMIASLTIIIVYVRVKEIRSPGRRMLVFLSAADFLTAAGNLFGLIWFASRTGNLQPHWLSPTTDVACKFQAGWSTFSSLSSFSWSVVIAVNIFMSAVYGRDSLTRRFAVHCHVFCWGFAAAVVALTASQQQFGYDQCTIYWCWVRRDYNGTQYNGTQFDGSQTYIWQLVTGKAYEAFTFAVTSVLFIGTWMHIRRQTRQLSEWQPLGQDAVQTYKLASRKLLFVPIVFIISRIFGIIRFTLNFTNLDLNPLQSGDESRLGPWIVSEYLAPLQGMGDSSQGLLNCLVFVFTTKALRDRLHQRLPRWMSKRASTPSPATSEYGSVIGYNVPRASGTTGFL